MYQKDIVTLRRLNIKILFFLPRVFKSVHFFMFADYILPFLGKISQH